MQVFENRGGRVSNFEPGRPLEITGGLFNSCGRQEEIGLKAKK
jgi:hypothetical protein